MDMYAITLPREVSADEDFRRNYHNFRQMFEEARSIVGFLSENGGNGDILQVDGINSRKLRYIADNIEEAHESLIDEIAGLDQEELRNLRSKLISCGSFINYLEENCRAYSEFFRDKKNPRHLFAEETSRVRPLPATGSYHIAGERIRFKEIFRGLLRSVFS